MKNLLILVVALLTTTMLFAATQSPEDKGKQFAKKMTLLLLEDDDDEKWAMIEALSVEMGEYIVSLNEESVETFFDAYVEGIYYYFGYYGLGEEAADIYLEAFFEAMLAELE